MGRKGTGKKAEQPKEAKIEPQATPNHGTETIRIITGSYEHNLLCLALTLPEIFTPIFHFAPHTQSIRCLAASKRYLVSGSNDELIKLYDLKKRKELGTLMEHTGQVLSLQFYADKWLFSAASDGGICIWRVKDWELLAKLKGHQGAVQRISIHPSGRLALSVDDKRRLILWNLMTARKAASFNIEKFPVAVEWIPVADTQRYLIAYRNKLALHSSSKPEFELDIKDNVMDVKFHSGEDLRLYIALSTGTILVYKVDSGLEQIAKLEGHSARVKEMALLDGYMSSVSSDGKIVVWDLKTHDQIAVYCTGDRLNTVLMVRDDVEQYVKRSVSPVASDVESETEAPKTRPKKRAKVLVRRS